MWSEVNALFQKGWTLDDALHEVCNVRCLLPSLLQPRPALLRHYSQPTHSKGLGKSQSFGKKEDYASSNRRLLVARVTGRQNTSGSLG